MWDIKEYKPIALVFYIDGNGNRTALPLEESKREAFKKAIETSKMVELEWITINTFDIKEIRPAWSTSDLEKFFYSRSWQERAYITERTKKMSGDAKVNVVEYRLPLGTAKAIERLQWMVDSYHENLSNNE